jgi:hypothetical protein
MVRESVRNGDGERLSWQPFNHIANLQIILTIAIGRQPPGCYVVNAVKRHERIVVRLGDFVAEGVNIEHGRVKEETRLCPGRVVQDKSPQKVSVTRIPRLLVKAVKAKNTARSCVLNRDEQVGWRKEKG